MNPDDEKSIKKVEEGVQELSHKYLSPGAAKNAVLEALAKMELDIHKINIDVTMNDAGGDAKLQNGLTVDEAIKVIKNKMARLEMAYRDILKS